MIKGILCKMFNLVPRVELELIAKELAELKEIYAVLSQERAILLEKNSALQEQISKLIAEKDARIDTLQKENLELLGKISDLQNIISELNEKNSLIEKENKRLRQTISDSETKIATLTRENIKLIQSSSSAMEQIKDLEGKNEALKTQIKEYQTICEKYRERIKNTEVEKNTENRKLNNENQELKSNLSSLQKNTATLQSNISSLQEQNTALENEKKALVQNLSNTETKIATLTKENNKLIQSSDSYLGQIKDLENKQDIFTLQIINLQNLNEKHRQKINEYSERETKQIKEHTASVESLKTMYAQTIDTLQSEIQKYKQDLKEKSAVIGEYELTLIKRNKEIRDAKDENSKLSKELEEHKSSLSSFNKSYIQEISPTDIGNTQTLLEEDVIKLSSYRLRKICKQISQQTNTNIVSVSDKLINEFYLSRDHKNFFSFITNVVNNSPAFQKDKSIQGSCFHSIINDINKELSDSEIIRNAIAQIEKVKTIIRNNLNFAANDDAGISYAEKDDPIEEEIVDLDKIQINRTEVDIIKMFSDICYSISEMYMLNPQLKSIYKVALKSIRLYSDGKEKMSFLTFISCRSLDKKIPPSIKTTHIKILELIKKNKAKSDVINILQKDKSIFPYQQQKINTSNKDHHNGFRYIIRYPSTIHSKAEIEIQNNNKLIISNRILYLNRVSKKTRIKSKFISSIVYTTDNIYITHYLSKQGLIYLHKDDVHIIYGTDLKNITYDSIGQKFEIQLSEKKKRTISVAKILESIQQNMPNK